MMADGARLSPDDTPIVSTSMKDAPAITIVPLPLLDVRLTMSMRVWINNNPNIMSIMAVVVLVLVLGFVFMQIRGSQADLPESVYFLDLETNEVFEQPRGTIAPVSAPSSGRGVRAHLYTCGECTSDEWFGYLETFSKEARQLHQKQGEMPVDMNHHLVRDINGDNWVPYFSDAGTRIREQHEIASCPNDPARSPELCWP